MSFSFLAGFSQSNGLSKEHYSLPRVERKEDLEEEESSIDLQKPSSQVSSNSREEEVKESKEASCDSTDDYQDDAHISGRKRIKTNDGKSNGGIQNGGRIPKGGYPRKGKFRMQSKEFAITYPQCDAPRDLFDKAFREAFKPDEYASAREQHVDGNFHIHLMVTYYKRKNIQSAGYFDLKIPGYPGSNGNKKGEYHPNIKKVQDHLGGRKGWLEYMSKENDFGGDMNPEDLERNLAMVDHPSKGKLAYYHDYKWYQNYLQFSKFKAVQFPIKLVTAEATYEMIKPDPANKKRNWWIVAPPNTGKTRWIQNTFAGTKVWTPRLGKYPYEGYDGEEIIIYDDRGKVSFEEYSNVLNTYKVRTPVYGEVRFRTQDWPVNTTRSIIVLSNLKIEDSFQDADSALMDLNIKRMKKRFIQIINPVLINPDELSDNEEEEVKVNEEAKEAEKQAEEVYAAFR
nr:MAG: replication associated protein [Cressdnaviricota sp.]